MGCTCAASSAPTRRAVFPPHRAAGQLPDPVRRPDRSHAARNRPPPRRPAHIRFVVSADGYEPVTTHIFDRTDEYLGSDAVFAVKDSLICDFVRHDSPTGEAARLGIDPPFLSADFDFHLKPATEQRSSVLDAQQRLAALGAAG